MTTRNARAVAALAGPALVLAVAVIVSVGSGAMPIGVTATLSALAEGLRGHGASLEGAQAIVWNLRAPRVLMALVVGASLGSSGAAMQGFFRNPLADPYVLGVAGGASLGATLAMTVGGRLSAGFAAGPFESGGAPGWVPIFAFAGAAVAVLAVIVLSKAGTRSRTTSLLLAGIVVGTIMVAIDECLLLLDADRLRAVILWSIGNLSLASWPDVERATPYAFAGMALLFLLARGLDAMALGDDTARTLGVDTRRLRAGVIAGASLATAATVAYVGAIGFVGLVAPHVMRRLGPPGHRVLLPASALAGAALLVVADLGARTVIRPAELPVGIVTTLVGGPFFLWLLRRES
ncbi:MAG: FecCD family ABC transporter permease [Polyangiaceae bacterium]